MLIDKLILTEETKKALLESIAKPPSGHSWRDILCAAPPDKPMLDYLIRGYQATRLAAKNFTYVYTYGTRDVRDMLRLAFPVWDGEGEFVPAPGGYFAVLV